ncbi:MAG TPA: serine/threonine-protein kinase [Kofleriaceae bacterium]|jgi:serine/threonine-protein kinase
MIAEGTELGPYRIVKKIGEGGMGSVYVAQHSLLGRRAAIKVLLPALSSQREIVDRFFNEARATTSVTDPGIVQVFDFGFDAERGAYIVMELLDGESLEARLRRGAISVADALRLTRQVAGSLAAAHARGIVHRDLKPDNIFIVRDGEAQGGERPKILDFGIAKLTAADGDRSRTRTGMVMGTPIYMSPEQCRGAGAVDHRADIYSLGCVLYHLLAGRPPFDFEGVGEIISAHLREAPRPPSTVASNLPPAIDQLVLRCLAKNPDERFASMTELQLACEAQLAKISGIGMATIAIPPPQAPSITTMRGAAGEATPRPHRTAWLAAAVTVVAAAAAILFTLQRARGDGGEDSVTTTPAVQPAARPMPAPTPAPPPPAPPPVQVTKVVAEPALGSAAGSAAEPAPIKKPAPHHAATPPRHATAAAPQPKPGDLYDAR